MLSIVSPILLLAAITASAINRCWHRVKCALAVLIPTALHYYFFNHLNSAEYYLAAMACNAMSIGLLDIIKRGTATRLIVHLQILSFAFMLLNFAGAMIWYSYMSPSWYNALCLALAIIEALRIFIHTDGDRRDGIDSRDDSWNTNADKRGVGSGS